MNLFRNLLTAVIVLCPLLGGEPAAHAVEPVYTSRGRFRIPFQFDAAEIQRLDAREVRLFLSVDQGRSWQHVKSADPGAGRFDFEAPGDGDYWFDVRTVDSAQRLHPAGGTFAPGLAVVVDSTPPVLDLKLSEPVPGRIQVDWQTRDPNVDESQLVLEYQDGPSARWQRMAIVPKSAGRTSWTIPNGGVVAVRGHVADRCGNVGNAQGQVRLAASRTTTPIVPSAVSTSTPTPPAATQMPAPPLPSRQVTQLPAGAYHLPDNCPTPDHCDTCLPGTSPAIRPQSSGAYAAPQTNWAAGGTQNRRIRLVKSKRFQIGYKLDDVGPSGVAGVELFVTEDNGASWYKYGDDDDRRSPFSVVVPGEGTYGFTMRARSGAGLASQAPQPGNAPTVTVAVDLTPPTVQLQPVQTRVEGRANQVVINWSASDANPASRPVSIAYAPSASGPWEPISGWQADTGSFAWMLGRELPTRVYFRVTLRDAAGNIAHAVTPEPIVVDTSRPSARIVDVEAIEMP